MDAQGVCLSIVFDNSGPDTTTVLRKKF